MAKKPMKKAPSKMKAYMKADAKQDKALAKKMKI